MSRITWQTRQHTSFDPWAGGDVERTLRTGWTCICGKTSPKRLGHLTLEDYAAHHLAEHGAPMPNHGGPCACEWEPSRPVASMPASSVSRQHEIHHNAWAVDVWDS